MNDLEQTRLSAATLLTQQINFQHQQADRPALTLNATVVIDAIADHVLEVLKNHMAINNPTPKKPS